MPSCEFWDKAKCQKYGTWREDQNRYLCDDHYSWHNNNTEKLKSGIKSKLGIDL